MNKPDVTVNPTGDPGAWGLEKARRMTEALVRLCDRRPANRHEEKMAAKAAKLERGDTTIKL